MLRIFISAALISIPLTVFGQNTSTTSQTGVNNFAGFVQTGTNNLASINQNGGSNAAFISQMGDDFIKSIVQNGTNQGYGSFQVTVPGYTGPFSSISVTRGNNYTSMTLDFEVTN